MKLKRKQAKEIKKASSQEEFLDHMLKMAVQEQIIKQKRDQMIMQEQQRRDHLERELMFTTRERQGNLGKAKKPDLGQLRDLGSLKSRGGRPPSLGSSDSHISAGIGLMAQMQQSNMHKYKAFSEKELEGLLKGLGGPLLDEAGQFDFESLLKKNIKKHNKRELPWKEKKM